MSKDNPENGSLETHVLSHETIMTGKEFRGLGISQVAYFKPTLRDGVKAVAIHAADGTRIAVTKDEQSAVDKILKSRLIPSFLQ